MHKACGSLAQFFEFVPAQIEAFTITRLPELRARVKTKCLDLSGKNTKFSKKCAKDSQALCIS